MSSVSVYCCIVAFRVLINTVDIKYYFFELSNLIYHYSSV